MSSKNQKHSRRSQKIDSSIKHDWNEENSKQSDITFKQRQFYFTPASILSMKQ